MGNAGVTLAIILVVTWSLQMVLSVLQAKRYFKRVNAMRRFGRVATGLAGGRYRGRTYGMLAVDIDTRHITHAEQFAGWTVFASPKSVPQLVGVSLDMLLDNTFTSPSLSPRTIEAFRAAARTLRDSFAKASGDAEAQEQGGPAAEPTASSSTTAGGRVAAMSPSASSSPNKSRRASSQASKRHVQSHASRRPVRPVLRIVKE